MLALVSDTMLSTPQDGTDAEDRMTGAVIVDPETVFLCGYTKGLWGDSHAGGYDFAGVLLDLSDGTRLWRWQVVGIWGHGHALLTILFNFFMI